MSKLTVNGRNVVTKISFSRIMRWEVSHQAQSGTETCSFNSVYAGTPGNLADNEFISSVELTALSPAYNNNAISFITDLSWTNAELKVSWYRNANDNQNNLRILAIVCKYE